MLMTVIISEYSLFLSDFD